VKHISKHSLDNRKGDMAEFYAVTWLWDKGYEVFKNCGCSGPIDLIATKDGEMTYIDVKTKSGKSGRSRTETQLDLNVRILNFNPATRKLNFVNHKNND
jgi:Holliday junction resolvase-like predicted endonuclease